MTDSRDLLKKISALRQRLDQAQGLAQSAAVALLGRDAPPSDPVHSLHDKVQKGAWEMALLDGCVKQLPEAAQPAGEGTILPTVMTARAVRLVRRGKELLEEIRALAEPASHADDPQDPLELLHHDVTVAIDSVLRTVQAFPSAPSAQMRLCEGLETILVLVDEKLQVLKASLEVKKHEAERIDLLADLLERTATGKAVAVSTFYPLAEEILAEARAGKSLRFLYTSPKTPARHIAGHSLTTAHVLARLIHHDHAYADRLCDRIVTALLHDVGMVQLPADTLSQPEPLNDEQRRLVERHPTLGAEMVSRLYPGGGWPIEAVADHHERVDGTGYPAGRVDVQLDPFTKLLAVCDVYAALCCRRPYRLPLDTRTALTDTLLLAEQGALDKNQAERLLALSFFPVGSVVEMSDGCVAIVVANPTRGQGQHHPAKPVVTLLTDAHGLPVASPCQVDLLDDGERSILRTLPPADRRQLLAKRFPILV